MILERDITLKSVRVEGVGGGSDGVEIRFHKVKE